MNENKKPTEIQVELNESIAEGVYANFVIVTHSDSEFIFDFARFLSGKPKVKVYSRVIMNPKNAKLFLNALTDNIKKYETRFGQIKGSEGTKPRIGIKPEDEDTVN